jgi:hypothetical protein
MSDKRERTKSSGGGASQKKRSKTSKPPKPVCTNVFERRFFQQNPAKMRISDEYKSALAAHEASWILYRTELQAWAIEAVQEDQDTPYDKRSTASLERECDARCLDSSGIRDILIQRLLRHDVDKTDKTVTTKSMLVLEKTTPVTFFIDPQAPHAWYADADAIAKVGLLALPHDIIRRCILKFLDECSDYHVFRSLMATCKFLHADVTLVLLERSQHRFGAGGTLQALSALNYIAESRRNAYNRYRHICDFAAVMEQDFGFEWGENAIGYNIEESPWTVGTKILKACISKYGSIEGFRKHKAKIIQLATNKQVDELVVIRGRRDRYINLMKALEERGYPKLFDLIETDPDNHRTPCLSNVDTYHEFHGIEYGQDHWKKAFAKCASHVRKGVPETLKAVLKSWPESQAERYAQWKAEQLLNKE